VKSASSSLLDASAIGLSGLCLIHCLALPLVAALTPAVAAWAGAEWIHGAVVLVAVPLSALALWRRGQRLSVAIPAVLGLALLALGALHWPEAALETPITVAGSLALAAAHLTNWRGRHAH
jgi:hypothetical protein